MRWIKKFFFPNRCSLWFCFRPAEMWLQFSAMGRRTRIGYCYPHAEQIDEMARAGEISEISAGNYTPLGQKRH